MMTDNITNSRPLQVAVIGAGLMGSGLALVFAEAGCRVSIFDTSSAALRAAKPQIAANLRDLGRTTRCLDNITFHDRLDDAIRNADFVVEAIREDLDTKRRLFGEMETLVRPETILASNTSVIPISDIAERCHSRHRIIGTHWWNPPYLIPLVEVIETPWTDAEIIERTLALHRSIGKTPVHVRKDIPGFIGNRLQHALWREAIFLVASGVCDAQTVDTVVKNSFGARLHVLGPLENADLVGLDLTLAIHRTIFPSLDDSHQPADQLAAMVSADKLGMKTDEGFYRWTEDSKARLRRDVNLALVTLFGPNGAGQGEA